MGFVEDDGLGVGQQLGHAFFAQHQVGKEEVVVDHDHIGVLRLAAGLDDEALAVARAVAAQTVLARRGDDWKHG